MWLYYKKKYNNKKGWKLKYTTILPDFLFLATSALLPTSSYADGYGHDKAHEKEEQNKIEEEKNEGEKPKY